MGRGWESKQPPGWSLTPEQWSIESCVVAKTPQADEKQANKQTKTEGVRHRMARERELTSKDSPVENPWTTGERDLVLKHRTEYTFAWTKEDCQKTGIQGKKAVNKHRETALCGLAFCQRNKKPPCPLSFSWCEQEERTALRLG